MNSVVQPTSDPHNSTAPLIVNEQHQDDIIDLREILLRIGRGFPFSLGLALLGFVTAILGYLAFCPLTTATTSTRVVFSFDGYAQGLYPDKSKFNPEDLRSPDIILDALQRLKLDNPERLQSDVRSAITIEGVIPPEVIKERDRLRAAGQPPQALIPDEYYITLSLPRKYPIPDNIREHLLNEIVNAYRAKFQRTYASMPLELGSAFETLKSADYFEYELILNQEIQKIESYLNQAITTAKTFRSQTTNLSFADLLKQTEFLAQIHLNESLGLIRQNGLSKNRNLAMVKMDYYLRTLEDQENKAVEEEKVMQALLSKTRENSENYVLGMKSRTGQPKPDAPVLDQGLIDSLLANDAYNFLMRKTLEAGLAVKRIQAEKAVLVERRQRMEQFLKADLSDQAQALKDVGKSLGDLERIYNDLIAKIRKTVFDYERQQFADAIRISMQPKTNSVYRTLLMPAVVGFTLGLAAGIGLCLLELDPITRKKYQASADNLT